MRRVIRFSVVIGLFSSMLLGCGSKGPGISEEVYKQRAEEQKKQLGIPDDPKEMVLKKQQAAQELRQKGGKVDTKVMTGPMSGSTNPANP